MSASFRNAPMIEKIPATSIAVVRIVIFLSSGIDASARKLNNINAVALVGPIIVCFELENNGAIMLAITEQIIPLTMCIPAIAA